MSLLDCPPELVRMVLAFLPRKEIKQIRLVCKASETLSVGMLFCRLYVSPRKEDMKVFDAVSERPDLRISVKEICFDIVSFIIPEATIEEYYKELSSQLHSEAYAYLRATDPPVQRIIGLIGGPKGLGLARQDAGFLGGYADYVFMTSEQDNLLSDAEAWLPRVLEGLQSLGPIDSVCFINSFDPYWNGYTRGDETFLKDVQSNASTEAEVSSPTVYKNNDNHPSDSKRSIG